MIVGLLAPTAGSVSIAGVRLSRHPRRAKAHIGLVPQEIALYPTLDAAANLHFFGRLYGLRGTVLAERVRWALDAVQLGVRGRMAVSAYSNGMKRRLNLAAGLLHDPAVIVLDEATVGIDAQSRHAILSRLEDLARSGKTLLYCTHHLWEAEALCSRVAIMDSGRMIALDTPRELIRRHGTGHIRFEFETPVSHGLLEEVRRLGAVRQSSEGPAGYQLHGAEPETALKRLLELARHYDTPIRSAQLLEPTLETVFLNLTGRNVRD
jgi:ABC-2 type transport system ATP-binding protein